MRERTYRERLRGTYHLVLTQIARHIGDLGPVGRPSEAQMQALKDLYRAKFHLGVSTEAMSDSQLSDLINQVEADAACRGIPFPARQYREAAPQQGA